MGSACTCYLSYKPIDLINQEFKRKPANSTLRGKSPTEEPFITFNTSFHNTNFSVQLQKTNPQSAFASLKVPNDSDKIRVYQNLHSPIKGLQEEIVFEGELEKFKQNSSAQFTTRWCRVTTLSFSYYKNKWSTLQSPLYYVPLNLIASVKVVKNRIQKNNPEMFEFELILNGDEESGKRSKNTTREASIHSGAIVDEEVLVGERRLVFGTKDCCVFQEWVKIMERMISE